MTVQSLDSYRALYVHVCRFLPIGIAQNLAFAEHYYILGKRVAAKRSATVFKLDSNILVNNYHLQAAQVRQTTQSGIYLLNARCLLNTQSVSRRTMRKSSALLRTL